MLVEQGLLHFGGSPFLVGKINYLVKIILILLNYFLQFSLWIIILNKK